MLSLAAWLSGMRTVAPFMLELGPRWTRLYASDVERDWGSALFFIAWRLGNHTSAFPPLGPAHIKPGLRRRMCFCAGKRCASLDLHYAPEVELD